ncbi:hypothetical protein, partial [Klebsiella michiganensis]|uniref:hypothetical protein n=1 Tax=Klebsiella michiganensis TaxID=1134687 RepID=UPI001CB7C498
AYTGDKKDLPGYWPTFGYTPTVALSLRQLSASYTGPAIRVRRSSDNTEINIGFTAEGDLDTTALLNFCGSGNGFANSTPKCNTRQIKQPVVVHQTRSAVA